MKPIWYLCERDNAGGLVQVDGSHYESWENAKEAANMMARFERRKILVVELCSIHEPIVEKVVVHEVQGWVIGEPATGTASTGGRSPHRD